jgi:hypothetical protein
MRAADVMLLRRVWWIGAALALGMIVAAVQPGRGAALVDRVQPRPRLLFAPGEFAQFSRETTTVRRESFERLLRQIDELGTRGWNERDLQIESQSLAARVLLDRGDPRGGRYLDLARQSMRSLLNQHVFRRFTDAHELVTEGSRFLEGVALAHDWLYPYWTESERALIANWLDEEASFWVDTNRFLRASPSPFRNDAARGTAGLLFVALTLFDEPGHQATAEKTLSYIEPYYGAMMAAHAYAGIGGGMTEGTFYGNFTAFAQTLIAEALYTGAGIRNAYTRTPFYAARLRYAIHASWPGYLTNQFRFNAHQLAPVFGDARRGPTGSALYHRATVLLLGKRFPRTAAAREAYFVVNRDETSRSYTPEWGLYDVLFWSPAVTPAAPAALTYREPSLGQVFSRSDWSDGATWVSFNAGPHLDTHQHYDAGNLTIMRRVDLVVDSGSFDGFGSNHWYNYYARTVAHNTILVMDPEERWADIWGGVSADRLVNDGGQRTAAPLTPAPTLDEYLANRTAYDHGRIERFGEGAWGMYVRADLTNAYQNPQFQATKANRTKNRVKVTRVNRDVAYLRASGGTRDAVVVLDRVTAADPSFRKAVLWHARELFDARQSGRRIDEGEVRYEGQPRYDFETTVRFDQGPNKAVAQLFVAVLAIDPVRVRAIGRREEIGGVDHVTFNTPHHHRHLKDYLVEDPRPLLNPNRNTGAFGRPEWPPFNAPEEQWLFTDDLVGGWGQTRLQVEPAEARASDRFLTVLVPSDAGLGRPSIDPGQVIDGPVAAVSIRDGGRTDIVVFGTDPNGADLVRGVVDVPVDGRAGDLLVTCLTPGSRYGVYIAGSGPTQRVTVGPARIGYTASDAGVIHLPLSSVPHLSSAGSGGAAATVGGRTAIAPSAPGSESSASAGGGGADDDRKPKHPGLVTIDANSAADLAAWAPRIDRMIRAGELKLRESAPDASVPGRVQQRYTQLYEGVPVFGADISRQADDGQTTSIFGAIYEDIGIDPVPTITASEAVSLFQGLGGGLGPSRTPELMVLPRDDGYLLTYRARIATRDDVVTYFIDARTGEMALSFSELKRPSR